MPASYSTYEAKAKFSEVLRRVRAGEVVQITYRGEPLAEIRPLEPGPESVEARRQRFERERRILPRRGPGEFGPIGRRPGALKRFLGERE